ncbi:hypothetical protein [Nocardia terpenica]|uniref:DUF8175 domain-containing protein n=1 Tax=Nocardia terpenica TaxID=455432 RepID=A0A6G9Z6B6_9NOCA|nr:hypothetical protein [Nocardia terpenica]QIS21155.1 hypothetical protein F6W96_25350 [Nocardia terpenica]
MRLLRSGRRRALIGCLAIGSALILSSACTPDGTVGDQQVSTSMTLDTASPGDGTPLALVMSHWLTWQPWHGTRLPVSDRWGPAHVQADAATGFSHTAEGAVVAMMQHQARLAGLGDAAWSAAARAMAVVAPTDQPPRHRISTGFDSAGDLPYFTGFRWVSYRPDRAEADLALQGHDGALTALHATESWDGNDWKAELHADGGTVAPLPGLDGYQPWPSQPR